MGPPSTKEKIILNVARFFADTPTAHHKRQDILLHAFKHLVDGGLRDWELHLVGMIGRTNEDEAFVEHLRNAAACYPVHIRPAIEFDTLRDAYRKSSIYWHATGFGTSEAEQPSKQEHFGMSIVEAMSAGAVPIAFNAGGRGRSSIPASVVICGASIVEAMSAGAVPIAFNAGGRGRSSIPASVVICGAIYRNWRR
jgi:glycosyltransferase involved in cell wall biosynthesis